MPSIKEDLQSNLKIIEDFRDAIQDLYERTEEKLKARGIEPYARKRPTNRYFFMMESLNLNFEACSVLLADAHDLLNGTMDNACFERSCHFAHLAQALSVWAERTSSEALESSL